VRLARYPYEEYRRFEETTDAKHEYLHGQIMAMAGGYGIVMGEVGPPSTEKV